MQLRFLQTSHLVKKVSTSVVSSLRTRFNIEMIQSWDKVVLFKHSAFDSVFSLLDNHIPLRKFLLETKFDPSTNAERKPENEKLSKICSKEKLVEALRKKWGYYNFCDKLRGSLTVLDVG